MIENNKEKIFVGFLSVEESKDKDRFIGNLLVTNERGVPLEFRCTLPIKPTSIQKPLYGKSLIPHVSLELCGKPLLFSIQHQLSCIFVNSKYLLDIRKEKEIPLLYVKRSGKELQVDDPDNKEVKNKIESSSNDFEPIVAITHEEFKDDYQKILAILGDNIKSFDVVEPFSRIKTSVEVLTVQDERFK